VPLPIAHGMVGASVLLASRKPDDKLPWWQPLVLGAALGILPDADLALVWILDWGILAHGAMTHSIVFALCVGTAVAVWRGKGRRWHWREVLVFGGAVLTHGVLDMLVRKDFGGAALYWPFSDEKLRFGLFDYFPFFPGSEPLEIILWRALRISAYETVLFMPCLLAAWLIYVHRRKTARREDQTEQWPVRVD
jgi:membrane-bound metal-dependent hydrolase YbcI (DUF457 family)